jgi:hypothetical protein
MDSILTSIKKLLGIAEDYKEFDTDIIIHINTAFSKLNQLGVGPEEGFSIKDKTSVWTEFLADAKNLESVKTYVYLIVRLVFDPPQSSAVMTSMENTINQLEWRLNVAAEQTSS